MAFRAEGTPVAGTEAEPEETGEAGGFEAPVRRFERVAAGRPGAIALEFEGGELTYGELEGRSNRLARRLVALGVRRETAVAVSVAPSHDIVVAMLAIWKAGGVYVPLDPGHPAARVEAIVEETRPLLLLTRGDHGGVAPGLLRQPPGDDGVASEGADEGPPEVEIAPEQSAYIFYTSGTTGRPKGVAASHGNLAFYTGVARDRYGFSAGDTFCSIARYTFSISLFELLSPLLCGGRLILLSRAHVLEPERLAGTLERVSVLHAGPSLLRRFFRYLGAAPGGGRVFERMRHASSGGDMVPAETLEDMKRVFPGAEIFVIYGCTEVSCMGCTYAVPRGSVVRRTVVGKPFAGVEVRVLDAAGQRAAAGEVGRVYIGGAGVTLGPVNRPEAGGDRYVSLGGRRHYATGDLGRLSAAGDLEIMGREDDQVQLHGMRVEPVEIEHALRQAPRVSEAAVAAFEGEDGEKFLVAYVVGDGGEGVTFGLRRFLLGRLPDYMVPTEFVELASLPLTPNLKVDRRALPAPARARAGRPEGALGPALEARVGRIFSRYLGLERVGDEEDFFELGGSSLLALRVTDELNGQLGLALPLHTLFQCASVGAVARLIRAEATLEPRPVPLNSNRHGPPLFMLAAVHIYRDLARELARDYSVSGLSIDQDPGPDGGEPVSLEELASAYVALLRKAQPGGPYRLAGYSFGGLLAFEVARQLRKQGGEVAHLWLLDAVLPLPAGGWRAALGRLAGLTAGQRAQVAAWGLRQATARRRGARQEQPAPAAPPSPGDRVLAMDALRTRSYLDAARAYAREPRPYDGAATLVVAGRRFLEDLRQDPTCGWSGSIRGLRLEFADAHHLGLLSGPPVLEVAAAFRAGRGPRG